MQVLKDSVRNAIVEAAQEEFCKKGYKKASIRSIAAKSNTTPGNMYRYFESKGALYTALVGPVFQKILDLVALTEQMTTCEVNTSLIARFVEICNQHPKALWMLTHGSEGSPFEKGIEKINRAVEKMVLERWDFRDLTAEDQKLQRVLASAKCRSLVMGITMVLQSQLKMESMAKALDIYIQREAQTLFLFSGEKKSLP